MLRITFFSGYFYLIIQILIAYLRINNVFYVSQMSNIVPKIILIVTIILSTYGNIIYLPIGILLSVFIQFLMLIVFSSKFSLFSNKFDKLFSKNINVLFRNALPLLISGIFIQLNTVVDKSISSSFGEGSITILSYAAKLTGLVITIFLTPITAVFFPEISKLIAINRDNDLKGTINKNLLFSLYLVVPSAFGLIIFSSEIVSFIYGRGSLSTDSIMLTSLILSAYSFTLITNVITTIIGNIFFSYKDTRIPVIIGFVTIIINVVLSLFLSKIMGIVGLPLGTTISSLVSVFLHFKYIKKYVTFTGNSYLVKESLKIFISAIIMFILLILISQINYFDLGLLGIILGAFIYIVTTIIFSKLSTFGF